MIVASLTARQDNRCCLYHVVHSRSHTTAGTRGMGTSRGHGDGLLTKQPSARKGLYPCFPCPGVRSREGKGKWPQVSGGAAVQRGLCKPTSCQHPEPVPWMPPALRTRLREQSPEPRCPPRWLLGSSVGSPWSLTCPLPPSLPRPQREPLLLQPADMLERAQEANSLTFTNPISLSPHAVPFPCCAPSFHPPNKKQAPSEQLFTALPQKQDREKRSLAAPQGWSAIIEANKP